MHHGALVVLDSIRVRVDLFEHILYSQKHEPTAHKAEHANSNWETQFEFQFQFETETRSI